MKRMNRRKFLRLSSSAVAGAALSQFATPSVVTAQSAGSGKNMIVINLLGGMDGLEAFPFLEGGNVSIINNELRPTLGIDPANVLFLDNQSGISNKRGLHSAFQPLLNVAQQRMKLVQQYGIPGNPGRSHDTCQILMSLGVSQMQTGGDMVGFLGRLMDSRDWQTMQYWALGNTNASDVNTRKNPPVSASDLEGLNYARISWEGDPDRDLAVRYLKELQALRTPTSPISKSYGDQLAVMHDTVSIVRSDIISQQVGNNSAGNYSNNRIGRNLRDAAKVLRAKGPDGPNFNYQDQDMVILCSQSGYDTHADQGDSDLGLANLLGSLAQNLAVLYVDLQTFGLLDDTVIVVYSEFGRTCTENATGAIAGTDHGHAGTSLVLGGPVRTGVIGAPPTATDLRDEDYNALRPIIDYRDIFSDVLQWMNVDPKSVFDDSQYNHTPLGLMT